MSSTKPGRNMPFVSFTCRKDQAEFLNDFQLFISVKKGRVISQSETVQWILDYAVKHQDEISDLAVNGTKIGDKWGK